MDVGRALSSQQGLLGKKLELPGGRETEALGKQILDGAQGLDGLGSRLLLGQREEALEGFHGVEGRFLADEREGGNLVGQGAAAHDLTQELAVRGLDELRLAIDLVFGLEQHSGPVVESFDLLGGGRDLWAIERGKRFGMPVGSFGEHLCQGLLLAEIR